MTSELAPPLQQPAARTEDRESAPDRRPPRQVPRKAIVMMASIVLAVIFATPLLWMISASLKPESEVMQTPPRPFGSSVLWGNYLQAARTLLPYFINSMRLAALNVGFLLLFAALAGYAFGRLEFAFKRAAFALLLSTAMIPSMVYLLPQYMMFREIHWIDTYYPLWVPQVLTPVFGTFLLRQSFRGIPMELEEAAKIDGASTFAIFWRIMLPQVKPALAAVGVFTFMGSWNDLFGPLIFLNSTRLQTMPIALTLFRGEYFSQTNLMMAAATLTTVPPLLLFLIAQKYFVQGITMSGLKG
jgi:multiple sugar transport system permease protein